MKIISLKNTKKTQPNVFKAVCESGEIFELHTDAMLEFGINVHNEIDAQVFIKAVEKSEWLIACAKAMDFVSRQLKTAKQLRTYLYKKGYSTNTVNKLVDKMKSYNLVSDETYAKNYSNSMQKSKSKTYIKNKLFEAGVSPELIDETIAEIDDSESAKKIVDKYFHTHTVEQKNLEKLIRHLQYKGYTWDTINSCIQTYKDQI